MKQDYLPPYMSRRMFNVLQALVAENQTAKLQEMKRVLEATPEGLYALECLESGGFTRLFDKPGEEYYFASSAGHAVVHMAQRIEEQKGSFADV